MDRVQAGNTWLCTPTENIISPTKNMITPTENIISPTENIITKFKLRMNTAVTPVAKGKSKLSKWNWTVIYNKITVTTVLSC